MHRAQVLRTYHTLHIYENCAVLCLLNASLFLMAYPPGGYGYPPQGGYVQETVNVTPYGVQETVVAQTPGYGRLEPAPRSVVGEPAPRLHPRLRRRPRDIKKKRR
jgi:hypothetical protein